MFLSSGATAETDRGIADRCLSRGRYSIAWCSNPAEPKVELHRERVGTVGEVDFAGIGAMSLCSLKNEDGPHR
jgi:hypothetical protein